MADFIVKLSMVPLLQAHHGLTGRSNRGYRRQEWMGNMGKEAVRFHSAGMNFMEFAIWVSCALAALMLLAAL